MVPFLIWSSPVNQTPTLRKLSLSRETLKSLQDQESNLVAAGNGWTRATYAKGADTRPMGICSNLLCGF